MGELDCGVPAWDVQTDRSFTLRAWVLFATGDETSSRRPNWLQVTGERQGTMPTLSYSCNPLQAAAFNENNVLRRPRS